MRPRRAQESPGVAQNSPGANSKPDEVPKSLRVRMRALNHEVAEQTYPKHICYSNINACRKTLRARIRAHAQIRLA